MDHSTKNLRGRIVIGLLLIVLISSCRSTAPVKPLSGSHNPYLHLATEVGTPPDTSRHMQVVLTLRRGEKTAQQLAQQLQTASFATRQSMNRAAFNRQYQASESDIRVVEKFARRYGLAVVNVDRPQRLVVLDGNLPTLEKAFGVTIRQYELNSTKYLGHMDAIDLPTDLLNAVTSVQGLHNFPVKPSRDVQPIKPALTRSAQDVLLGYSGAQMANLYHFPQNTTGKGQCIGLLELDGDYAMDDIKKYFQLTGGNVIPGITNVYVAPQDSVKNGIRETNLDLQVAASAAPGAKYAVYFGPNTKSGFLQTLKAAIHDTINQPTVISISWGNAESNWSEQEIAGFTEALQDAALLNITVTVSTGDAGSSDGQPDGKPHVQFPASSPYVLACGGTTITVQADSISDEVVWSNWAAQTGGGFSTFFSPSPVFQTDVIPQTIQNWAAGRGIPDVSFHADKYSGYLVVLQGDNLLEGGTSAVAPLWAALVARLNESLGVQLGYVNPLLYQLKNTSVFRPTLQGGNGHYVAGAVWNPCTGLGSVNGDLLLNQLRPLVKK